MRILSYLLQIWGEICCGWTYWWVGAGGLVWPWAPSISSPRTSGAVSGKHEEDQPQGGRREAFLDMEWQYLGANGWEEVNHARPLLLDKRNISAF